MTDERVLCDRARAGDDEAFDLLVRAHFPRVYAAAFRLAGNHEDAEDLAQETFLALLRGGVLGRADPARGRFRALLLAVARHALAHHRERGGALKRGGGLAPASLDDVDVARAPAPDEAFDRAWTQHLVSRALTQLERERPQQHAALRLFALEGLAQDEVAARLATTRANVKTLVHRGRERLAQLVREAVRDYCRSPAEVAEELALLDRLLPP